MGGTGSMHEDDVTNALKCCVNLKGRDYLGDLAIDVEIILKRI
jgi:hypothetical protein